MKRNLLTEQDIVDRAAARRWRNSMWTWVYREQRRHQTIWASVLLLLMALIALLPIAAILYAKYGRP